MKPREFREGDLVLRLMQRTAGMHKLSPPWEGPFIVSKALKNGVYLVDLFGVVLRLHSTAGNSSSQQPGVFRNGSINLGFIPARTIPLALSTYPLDCGCATDARSSLIPFSP